MVIVAPHTSNWDFPICVLVMFTVGIQATWLGKHTLFRFPVAGLLRWLGGEPIDRRASRGTVGVAIERFRARAQWVLAVSPEGTRKRVAEWKSGFHRIARGVGVPILPVQLDYSRRVVAIGALFEPTDDDEGDITALRRRFSPEMALYPGKFAAAPPFRDSEAGRIFPAFPTNDPVAPLRSS